MKIRSLEARLIKPQDSSTNSTFFNAHDCFNLDHRSMLSDAVECQRVTKCSKIYIAIKKEPKFC